MWAFTYFLGSLPDLAHPLDGAVLSFWKMIFYVNCLKSVEAPFVLENNPNLILIYFLCFDHDRVVSTPCLFDSFVIVNKQTNQILFICILARFHS